MTALREFRFACRKCWRRWPVFCRVRPVWEPCPFCGAADTERTSS